MNVKRVAAAVVIAGLVGAAQQPFERAAPHAGYPKPA